jgi:hypothetical protein
MIMAVILNQPWPEGHPLKTGLIIFGQKRPDASTHQNISPAPSFPQSLENIVEKIVKSEKGNSDEI